MQCKQDFTAVIGRPREFIAQLHSGVRQDDDPS